MQDLQLKAETRKMLIFSSGVAGGYIERDENGNEYSFDIFMSQETFEKIAPHFKGAPIIIDNHIVLDETNKHLIKGHASNIMIEGTFAFTEIAIDNEELLDRINKGYLPSISYKPIYKEPFTAGKYKVSTNGAQEVYLNYDREVIGIDLSYPVHIALVRPNTARYDDVKVINNSLEEKILDNNEKTNNMQKIHNYMSDIKKYNPLKFIRKILNNNNEEKEEVLELKNCYLKNSDGTKISGEEIQQAIYNSWFGEKKEEINNNQEEKEEEKEEMENDKVKIGEEEMQESETVSQEEKVKEKEEVSNNEEKEEKVQDNNGNEILPNKKYLVKFELTGEKIMNMSNNRSYEEIQKDEDKLEKQEQDIEKEGEKLEKEERDVVEKDKKELNNSINVKPLSNSVENYTAKTIEKEKSNQNHNSILILDGFENTKKLQQKYSFKK